MLSGTFDNVSRLIAMIAAHRQGRGRGSVIDMQEIVSFFQIETHENEFNTVKGTNKPPTTNVVVVVVRVIRGFYYSFSNVQGSIAAGIDTDSLWSS